MPRTESVQEKLTRIRPPRVKILYEVETGGALEMKELPFVVGVVGDFSAQPAEPLPRLRDRKLVEIDRDNFDAVLKAMAPRVALRVPNRLGGNGDGGTMNVELRFERLDDFHPDNFVRQVEPLKKLVDARRKLSDLLSKTDGNDRLEMLLEDVLKSSEHQQELASALGVKAPAAPGDGAAPEKSEAPEKTEASDG